MVDAVHAVVGVARMPFAFPDPLYPIADADSRRSTSSRSPRRSSPAARACCSCAPRTPPTGALRRARARRQGARRPRRRAADRQRSRRRRRLVGAAGVHLGQDDLPPAAARAILGPGRDHRLLDPQPRRRSTPRCAPARSTTSPSARSSRPRASAIPIRCRASTRLRAVRARCALPLVAIGGITPRRSPPCAPPAPTPWR